jgi:hypothetical protein
VRERETEHEMGLAFKLRDSSTGRGNKPFPLQLFFSFLIVCWDSLPSADRCVCVRERESTRWV